MFQRLVDLDSGHKSSWWYFSFIVTFFLCWFIKKYLCWAASPLFQLPSASTRRGLKDFLFGSMVQLRTEPFMEPQTRWWKKAGLETPMIHFTALFGRHNVLILNAEIVKEVLTDTSHVRLFPKHYPQLLNVMGDSLVTSNGEAWKRQRRICQPAFLASQIKKHLEESVEFYVSKLTDCWLHAAGKRIDLISHFSAITLDVLGSVCFSHKYNALDYIENWCKDDQREGSDNAVVITEKLFDAMSKTMKNSNFVRISLMSMGLSKLENYLVPSTRKINRVILELIDEVILNAKKLMDDSKKTENNTSNFQNKSLLQLLLSAEDPETKEKKSASSYLTHVELQDAMRTFTIAGHETTATMCTWAAFCLSLYPKIQTKVYEDVVNHSSSGFITLTEIESMSYFQAFLKEVMRLYPPIPITFRRISRTHLVGGVEIPKGTRIGIPMYLLHRHPSYWGDDALEFRPERWLEKKSPTSHPFAFIPYSEGERMCIGRRFADIEVKLITANLFRKFSFELAPEMKNCKIEFQNFVTLAPKQQLLAYITERSTSLD